MIGFIFITLVIYANGSLIFWRRMPDYVKTESIRFRPSNMSYIKYLKHDQIYNFRSVILMPIISSVRIPIIDINNKKNNIICNTPLCMADFNVSGKDLSSTSWRLYNTVVGYILLSIVVPNITFSSVLVIKQPEYRFSWRSSTNKKYSRLSFDHSNLTKTMDRLVDDYYYVPRYRVYVFTDEIVQNITFYMGWHGVVLRPAICDSKDKDTCYFAEVILHKVYIDYIFNAKRIMRLDRPVRRVIFLMFDNDDRGQPTVNYDIHPIIGLNTSHISGCGEKTSIIYCMMLMYFCSIRLRLD